MPWARLAVGLLFVAVLVGGSAALITPGIQRSKDEKRARERAQAEQRLRRARLEQRAHVGRGPVRNEPALLGRAERAIAADARSRGIRAKRVECSAARRGYDCLAVTSEIRPTATNKAGIVGVPFRTVLEVGRGRFAWCKVSPIPSERALPDPRSVAPLPRACRG